MKALHTSWSSSLALPRSKPKPVESCHEVSSKKRTNLRPPRPPNFEALPRPTQATSDQDVTSKRLLLSQATGPNQALPPPTLVVAKTSLQSSGNTLYCRHHYRHFLAVPSPTTGAPPIATFCCGPLIWAVTGASHRRQSYKAIDVALSVGGYVVLPCMWLRPPARSNPATCTVLIAPTDLFEFAAWHLAHRTQPSTRRTQFWSRPCIRHPVQPFLFCEWFLDLPLLRF